jgi:hypothetical protein
MLPDHCPGAFDKHPRVHLSILVRKNFCQPWWQIANLIEPAQRGYQLREEDHSLIIFRLELLLLLFLECLNPQRLKLRDLRVYFLQIHRWVLL